MKEPGDTEKFKMSSSPNDFHRLIFHSLHNSSNWMQFTSIHFLSRSRRKEERKWWRKEAVMWIDLRQSLKKMTFNPTKNMDFTTCDSSTHPTSFSFSFSSPLLLILLRLLQLTINWWSFDVWKRTNCWVLRGRGQERKRNWKEGEKEHGTDEREKWERV